jgi:hypothetical protein
MSQARRVLTEFAERTTADHVRAAIAYAAASAAEDLPPQNPVPSFG